MSLGSVRTCGYGERLTNSDVAVDDATAVLLDHAGEYGACTVPDLGQESELRAKAPSNQCKCTHEWTDSAGSPVLHRHATEGSDVASVNVMQGQRRSQQVASVRCGQVASADCGEHAVAMYERPLPSHT